VGHLEVGKERGKVRKGGEKEMDGKHRRTHPSKLRNVFIGC